MEKAREFKIETIVVDDNSVSYCPSRGGIITSLKLGGREMLYMDEGTLRDKSVQVRGGIPILFPNAGILQSTQYPNLARHGFARDSSAWTSEKIKNGFRETLISSKETLAIFPYQFRLTIVGTFEQNGSFTLKQELENTDDNTELPVAMGLHPYFIVSHDAKRGMTFDGPGGKEIQEHVEEWANGTYCSFDNPRVLDPTASLDIVIPEIGTVCIDASPEYTKLWVWSEVGKDFACIEPVMRDEGGLVEDPVLLKAGETVSASVRIALKH